MCILEEDNANLTPCGKVWKPFECDIPEDIGYTFELVDGVFQIIGCVRAVDGHPNKIGKAIVHPYPCIAEFMEDQKILLALSTHGPV